MSKFYESIGYFVNGEYWTILLVSTSHNLTDWSALAVTSLELDLSHPTAKMLPVWLLSELKAPLLSPVFPSYKKIFVSAPTETRDFPSGEKDTS
jgi:hypothetical protein